MRKIDDLALKNVLLSVRPCLLFSHTFFGPRWCFMGLQGVEIGVALGQDFPLGLSYAIPRVSVLPFGSLRCCVQVCLALAPELAQGTHRPP